MTSTLTGAGTPGIATPSTRLGRRAKRIARSLWRGRAVDAAWVRPAFLGLLVLAAFLDVWDLAASGWANAFYSAAAQAGATNWEAFLYGSSDAGNSITVDKPPASLWVMALSVRLFGLSTWSILLPEALMGVATVALVHLIVRRRFAPGAALIAGAVTALTPVAVLMFRFNNPDALLVLLVTLATYLTLRGIEDGRARWILWAGVAVGFGFLTKQLQAFLVVPVLAGVYLFASPRRLGARFVHLAGALGTLVLSAGWWVAIVELVPAGLRPFIGGSQTNDFLELTFGYNGFGRLTGQETGSVTGGATGGGAGGGMWGATGLLRLFGSDFGSQISWLLPAALGMLVVGIVLTWRRPRVDAARATVLLLGGTLLVTGLAFSFGAGIIHPYYSVALAPAIGGLVGIGAALLWAARGALWARITAAAIVLATAAWAVVLLSAARNFLPWLAPVVAAAGLLGAAALVVGSRIRALGPLAIVASLVAGLAGPAAFAVDTTLTPHTGSLPTAGPAVSLGSAGRPGLGGTGTAVGGRVGAQNGSPPPQGVMGGRNGFAPPQGGFGARAFGAAGGLLGGSTTVSSAVTDALKANASRYTWAAAAIGSQNAASYQLATGLAVMPIGGFNGSDPSPSLAEFEQDVAAGRIHYFIASGMRGGGSNGGSDGSAQIAAWVEANFPARTVGGVTLYDLSGASSGSASSGTAADA